LPLSDSHHPITGSAIAPYFDDFKESSMLLNKKAIQVYQIYKTIKDDESQIKSDLSGSPQVQTIFRS